MYAFDINELTTQEMPYCLCIWMCHEWFWSLKPTVGFTWWALEFRKALLRFWWAISPQVHNHCTGGPGKWWATTGGPGERHWNRGWAEAVKATCNGHQCYTGAMGALLLGHHDHAQNFEQRQKDSAQWDFNLPLSTYLYFVRDSLEYGQYLKLW